MKAIVLLSGGLDSKLAAQLLLEQDIQVIGVHFVSPFYSSIKKQTAEYEIKEIFLDEEYIELVRNPKYGYGRNLNPCIDCKIFMLKKAKQIMKTLGASFIATGEVLKQRPMSQNYKMLQLIEKESGLEGYLLRPLSAKLLPETIPEKNKWVNRDKLLAISGKMRKKQLELAEKYGLKDIPQPAGGCLLTDPIFSKKLKDLFTYSEKISLDDIELLKIGRHFRISENFKVVIGRNQKENDKLKSFDCELYTIVEPVDAIGPVGVAVGSYNEEQFQLFLDMVATYCDGNSSSVKIKNLKGDSFHNGYRTNKEYLAKLNIGVL